MRKAKTPLTPRELVVLAAAFARSNMGQGRPEQREVQRLLALRDVTLSGAVLCFCEPFVETDEHQRMFEDEARGWVRELRKFGREGVQETWPDMAALAWPVAGAEERQQ